MENTAITYTCVKPCFFQNRMWAAGETLRLPSGEIAPKWFTTKEIPAVVVEKRIEPTTFSGMQKAEAEAVLKDPLSFLD